MTTTGIVVTSILGVFLLLLSFKLIRELIWNHRLKVFQKAQFVLKTHTHMIVLKRSFSVVILLALFSFSIFSGVFNVPVSQDRRLYHAQTVGSKNKLSQLVQQSDPWARSDFLDFGLLAPEADFNDEAAEPRDFIDTNVQVEGIKEADIIKTDGYHIYYAPRYQNVIRVIEIDEQFDVVIKDDIELNDFYIDNLFLTDDYLVAIGYVYRQQSFPHRGHDDFISIGFPDFYMSYTGALYVIDLNTQDIVYTLETDGSFYDYRMIDDTVYLISKKSVNDEELRPSFNIQKNNERTTQFVSYDEIFYFEDVTFYSMSVFSTLDLSQFTLNAQAYLTDISHMYMSHDYIYIANNFYEYRLNHREDYVYEAKSQIIKFSIQHETHEITYEAQQVIGGHVYDSFYMDHYDGYFRVATKIMWPVVHNQLFILESDPEIDQLNVVNLIDEGIGKPNEDIKAVRFNEHLVYIVTFETVDPVYTIDLSDVLNPQFIGQIEEPGYSVYLHRWLQDHQLIGFGYETDEFGFPLGLKLSAYDTQLEDPLYTVYLREEDALGFEYSYSEGLYNHKALMVSPEHGIFGLPVMTFKYYNGYSYEAQYMIFMIDFENETIISEPIVLKHDQTENFLPIERAVYIEGYVFTFSLDMILKYHLESEQSERFYF